jgi:hypothetical protein
MQGWSAWSALTGPVPFVEVASGTAQIGPSIPTTAQATLVARADDGRLFWGRIAADVGQTTLTEIEHVRTDDPISMKVLAVGLRNRSGSAVRITFGDAPILFGEESNVIARPEVENGNLVAFTDSCLQWTDRYPVPGRTMRAPALSMPAIFATLTGTPPAYAFWVGLDGRLRFSEKPFPPARNFPPVWPPFKAAVACPWSICDDAEDVRAGYGSVVWRLPNGRLYLSWRTNQYSDWFVTNVLELTGGEVASGGGAIAGTHYGWIRERDGALVVAKAGDCGTVVPGPPFRGTPTLAIDF